MIRILLAEDQHLIRGALSALIGLEEDMQVVAEVEEGDRIVPTARDTRPDVAVLDIELPGMDGLEAATILRDELPETRVLILTGLGAPGHLARARECSIRAVRTGGQLELELRNDGAAGRSGAGGTGLPGLADRLAARGGVADAALLPNGHFVLRVTLPQPVAA